MRTTEILPARERFDPDPAIPLALLAQCPAHRPTPLKVFGLPDGRTVMVKDESARMGLGAFKALGGVYAVARIIQQRVAAEFGESADHRLDLAGERSRGVAAGLTFVCASAGNHGLSVAAGARLFGAHARIYIAETVPDSFAGRLSAMGAEVVKAGATYEDSLQEAEADADRSGAQLLADGSWEGYTGPPALVMEGYTVIAEELRAHFEASGGWPDAVYLQAGVGGLAAAMAEQIRRNWRRQPRIVVVEPDAAPCLRASAEAGRCVTVEGPVSSMGRLDCKAPSLLALDVLVRRADAFETVSETEAADAVQLAAAAGLGSTPSGAAGLAAARRGHAANPLVILSEGPV